LYYANGGLAASILPKEFAPDRSVMHARLQAFAIAALFGSKHLANVRPSRASTASFTSLTSRIARGYRTSTAQFAQ
jgi:hypothetical protein